MSSLSHNLPIKYIVALCFTLGLFFVASVAEAASLYLSPSTGVYTSGNTFTVRVLVNTSGAPINAAEGTLSFNPNELSVVSAGRTGSIFSLWVAEPAYSNSAGTINFSGGLPSGYTGSGGAIMSVTFRTKGAGTARLNFTKGSVLANDGRGTNVLTAMNGGSYTVEAASLTPDPEVIEYIPVSVNTPGAPDVKSSTHPDPESWSTETTAELSWSIPSGVTGVRTLLSENPTSVPTKVYETPISDITIEDLENGESYFHIQFRNSDGWGRVTHYRLGVDTNNPSDIKLSLTESSDPTSPNQVITVEVKDETSDVKDFTVRINDDEAFDYTDETGSSTIPLPALEPGNYSVIVTAYDGAGNSVVGTIAFTIESFDKPRFTDYPSEINEEVIPVIKGKTRPNSVIDISVVKSTGDTIKAKVIADESGVFTYIPESTFETGVYELTAVATDVHGAQSGVSDPIKIAVQQPGYIMIGSMIVSILSVIIPLIILLATAVAVVWYLIVIAARFRRKVRVEATEALDILHREFGELQTSLRDQESAMQASRKTKKLTKAESEMIQVMDEALQESQRKVEKEISDITKLAKKKNK